MRLIKVFLIGLVALFIAITLFSLILPSNVKVSRGVVINDTTGKVYTQVLNLRNWKNWQPIFASNASVVTFKTGSDNNRIDCDIAYQNRQIHIITTAVNATSIKFILQSKGEDDIENEIDITPANAKNAVQVEWRAVTKLHWYPWEKFYGIFIDRMTGPAYEKALNDLKKFVESQP